MFNGGTGRKSLKALSSRRNIRLGMNGTGPSGLRGYEGEKEPLPLTQFSLLFSFCAPVADAENGKSDTVVVYPYAYM